MGLRVRVFVFVFEMFVFISFYMYEPLIYLLSALRAHRSARRVEINRSAVSFARRGDLLWSFLLAMGLFAQVCLKRKNEKEKELCIYI